MILVGGRGREAVLCAMQHGCDPTKRPGLVCAEGLAVHSDLMMQRQRSSTTVDIQCARCGKPMMMLSFNYTTLERGFESISLRCQYCKSEETRPWRRATEDEDLNQQATLADISDQSLSSNEVLEVDQAEQPKPLELTDDRQESSDDTHTPDSFVASHDPSSSPDEYEHLQSRFAGRPVAPPEARET
jgi:hypothetical protein